MELESLQQLPFRKEDISRTLQRIVNIKYQGNKTAKINKWANELNTQFSNRETQMANSYFKSLQNPQPTGKCKLKVKKEITLDPSQNDYQET